MRLGREWPISAGYILRTVMNLNLMCKYVCVHAFGVCCVVRDMYHDGA